MVDKEIFQRVKEIDLEVLIDNIKTKKRTFTCVTKNYLVNIFKVI